MAIRDRGATGPKARHNAASAIERLTALTTAWERAGQVTRQLAVTRVGPLHTSKGWEGYEAVHDCVLRSSSVDRASAMQDELTALPKLVAHARDRKLSLRCRRSVG